MQRPRGRGFPYASAAREHPRQGQHYNSPRRKTFSAPLSIVCVSFLPFQLPAPLSRQGTKHGGCKGVVAQGCGDIGVPGLGSEQIRAYERAGATAAFQRKCTTSGVSLLHYSFFNWPWRATTAKRVGCKGAGAQGCRDIGMQGIVPKQMGAYERARATMAFQRKCTTSGVSLRHYPFFNWPWRATPTKHGVCKRRRGSGV